MSWELIELYGLLEEWKLHFDNSFSQEDREYSRCKVIEIEQLIYEIKHKEWLYESN